jgi:hypothetical protein
MLLSHVADRLSIFLGSILAVKGKAGAVPMIPPKSIPYICRI